MREETAEKTVGRSPKNRRFFEARMGGNERRQRIVVQAERHERLLFSNEMNLIFDYA
jgi:hypothetical protein